MKKVFKTKKKRKHGFSFFILLIISIYISIYILNILPKEYLINNDLPKINLDKEKVLLKIGLNYLSQNNKMQDDENVFKEIISNECIYIYNTHQSEEYKDTNVLEVSKMIKNKLKGYNVIVEEENITEFILQHKMNYKDSYKVTRDLLINNIKNNCLLYIDIHRDSMNKETTTINIDNKMYAKVMFVIGGKHDNYKANYEIANYLNDLIKNYNKDLSRGILVRKSSSYNQDLADNILLIEIGGPENTKEEINNTLDILISTIKVYLEE